MNTYLLGQTVRVSTGDATTAGGFRTAAGALADPTTVELIVIAPSGMQTVYRYGVDAIVQRAGQGDYFAVIAPTAVDVWSYVWRGTTAGTPSATVAVAEGRFLVSLP